MEETKEEKSNSPLEQSSSNGQIPNSNESRLKQIRTFQGDVAEAIKLQKESLVSIQRAESVRRGNDVDANKVNSDAKHTLLLFLGSLVLLLMGAGGIWFAYGKYISQTQPPTVAIPENRFFLTDSSEEIVIENNLARQDLLQILKTSTGNVDLNKTTHVILLKSNAEGTNSPLTSSDLFKTLSVRAPGSLIRAFGNQFMYGAYGESVFLIIKVNSFENVFAGMLNWEKTMSADIGEIFAARDSLRELGDEAVFIDVTDRNKDIRILPIETEGKGLMYSFFDNNMLILTDNINTLRTIIDRLNREKLSR